MVDRLPSSLSLSTCKGPGVLDGERTTARAERARRDSGFFEFQNEQTKSWRFWVLCDLKRTNKEVVILGSSRFETSGRRVGNSRFSTIRNEMT
ncbi:hypothetical protein ACFX2C_022957 [Malus domestica]